MRSSRVLACGVVLLLTVLAGRIRSASAHEFWIQPATFSPAVGERVAVRLLVGTPGERDELPRRSDHLLRFDAVDAHGAQPVVGLFGRAPAGLLRPTRAGEVLLVYQGRHTFIELPAEKFESYLEEEALRRIVAERVRSGETLEPGRESYARYAKALVQVGGGSGARVYDREIGLPLEIVPETDPLVWQSGDPFSVRLIYDGEPLADQQVKLIHLDEGEMRLVARSDEDGRVRLQPPQPGPWLVATVFMRRAPEQVEGDWESFWGSLAFELPDGSDP